MSTAARPPRGTTIPAAEVAEPTAARADRPTPATAPAEPAYELVDIDRYVVLHDGPVGYIEVIPPLFICYAGHPYPRAVEVAQVFHFEQALREVLDRADGDHPARPQHHRPAA